MLREHVLILYRLPLLQVYTLVWRYAVKSVSTLA